MMPDPNAPNDVITNIWREFIAENIPNWEQLFANRTFKKSFIPFLRALREAKLRTVLQGRDDTQRHVDRGYVLAFEQIINLPGAIKAYKTSLSSPKASEIPEQSIYFGEESLDIDE